MWYNRIIKEPRPHCGKGGNQMKVIDVISRLLPVDVKISRVSVPEFRWHGAPHEVPVDLLDIRVYAISAGVARDDCPYLELHCE